MAASNRANRITKLVSSLKKHYKPVPASKDRTLLENLVFACLLEGSPHEAAEEAFERLKANYFDWNEVRVSTRRELSDELRMLNDPEAAADRLKRSLQSMFEGVYTFDLEPLKKQNLGQTVKQFQSYKGISPFAIAYVTQTSLGGHSIPVNFGLFTAFVTLDITTPAEAKAGAAPGLERAIPKSKGIEVGSMLHQLGVEVGKNPYGQGARKILLALDPGCKDRLPKRPAKAPEPARPTKKSSVANKKVAGKPDATATKTADKPVADKPAGKKSKPAAAKKDAPEPVKKKVKKKVKKASAKAPTAKKAEKKKVKKAVKKTVKKKTAAKRKPK
ncbi:hypothetical protein Pla123a_41270 [Posidoniimonas polymericola]|uniref:Endonuclease III n=1 Tax=Posidoniimonas polymericola TaxID=2528002 RepID=A0A5C5YAV4_9BACT|nr:tetratricopeptide repeat protein [Posidoniimonas polymericola]TWT72827.1 hypothetical protein Pla123a_41270 [Posidoniimonas polymericola]